MKRFLALLLALVMVSLLVSCNTTTQDNNTNDATDSTQETELSKEVRQEPALALFAEENGLAFYRKIIEQAPNYIVGNGYLMFELGINQAQEVKLMMEKDFENIEIIKDLAGIERVIYGCKK